MTTDHGRVGEPTGLSQAEPVSRLGPSGFDPSRIAQQIAALQPGWDLAADVLDGWASGFLTEGETGKTLTLAAKDLRENRDKVIESYVLNVGVFSAIATEAGTAETTQIGSVHEGAGPKDIAQPQSEQSQ